MGQQVVVEPELQDRSQVTRDAVLAALETVMDPHMNVSVVEMRMVREIDIENAGLVTVNLAFPCIGCPAWTMIQNDIKEAVRAIDGVTAARVKVVWDSPWRKEDLSCDTRDRIRSYGYQIFPME